MIFLYLEKQLVMVVSKRFPASFDTELTGGQLNYSNAKGIDASEIIVDGDGFITPQQQLSPEELVTEKLGDTVDIQVYPDPERDGSKYPKLVSIQLMVQHRLIT